MKELIKIQSELKAPKNQFNSFGKYKYRNAEDILEAVKPHLKENNCYLTLSDSIKEVGDRIYVEAVATIFNSEGQDVTVTASAREAATKKGMDESQITGAASSYARKYAMNGLFAIDDTKDADTTNKGDDKPKKTPATQEIVDKLKHLNREGQRNEAILLYNKHTFTDAQKEELKNG